MSDRTCTPEICANPGPRGGLCVSCQKARALRRYYAHADEMNAYNKRWRESDPERNKQRVHDWFEANAERRAEYVEEHRDEHNAKVRTRRAANPGGQTEANRQWRLANPEKWAQRNRENQRRRRAGGEIDPVVIVARDGLICHLCGMPIDPADLNMDHVIPLALGGPNTPENVKPAHALCNQRKGVKIA